MGLRVPQLKKSRSRKTQGRFNWNEGIDMPAFMFEKIAPPVPPGPASAAKAHRGVLIKLLDRLVEARMKRAVREEEAAVAREQKSSE
jgi:hypothetical protein